MGGTHTIRGTSGRRLGRRGASLACALALLTLLAVVPPSSAAAGEERIPRRRALKTLVARYLDATFAERERMRRDWDERLAPVSATSVKRLRETLLDIAHDRGPRLERSGTSYFYDEDAKRGKYIVRGRPDDTLFIGLHGGGAGAGNAGSAAGAMGGGGWWWVFPEVLEKTEHGWTDSGTEQFVVELIKAAKRSGKVDPDRIYVTGHSMGGYGAWTIGAHHADLFAGVGAYAGAPTCIRDIRTKQLSMVQPGILPSYFALPLHVFQSGDDANVPPASNDFATKHLAALKERFGGFPFTYDRVEGRGHAPPEEGYLPTQKRLAKTPRDPRPRRFLWQPVLSWKRQMYWVWWPRAEYEALVEFRAPGENRIEIETHEGSGDVTGMSVLLGAPLVDLDEEVVVVVNGEERFRGKVERAFSTLMMTLPREDPRLLFDARVDL